MEKIVNSTEETKQLAGKIATKLRVGDVLALYGDLGSGKTTFTQFLVEALGIIYWGSRNMLGSKKIFL